jgi:hypothetical protein
MSTSKKLLWLNGFAIFAVAVYHASSYTLQAMFEWTDRYMAVEVPNFDLVGSPSYYVLMLIRLVLTVAAPAFFFISGYFIGILAKGSKGTIGWPVVFTRVKGLLIPFLVWTVIRYVLLRDVPRTLDDIFKPYHWIPLLIQFYLLAPFIVLWARRNWKAMLIVIGLFGWSSALLTYGASFDWFQGAQQLDAGLPNWIVLFNFPFWVPFGVVFGLHYSEFKPHLIRYRRALLTASIVLSILVIAEYFIVDALTGPGWLGPGYNGFAKFPYYIVSILAFLGYEKVKMPLTEQVSQLGFKSLGIYLGNIPSVYVTAVLMYRLTPWLLGLPLVYFLVLTVVGLAIPLLMMETVRRSPLRRWYHVFFG